MVASRRAEAHVDDLGIAGDRIVSGELSAPVVHSSEHASIGEGDDGSLWILVHDAQRRPRGRDPGIAVEAAEIRFEENGLVRVLDRRVARAALEELVRTLTGQGARITGSLSRRSRIPDGDYDGLKVESIDSHYRVTSCGPLASRCLADMQSLGDERWLVVAGEESRLRRELVRHLMPPRHRAIWAAVRHGETLLMGLGILLALLSFVAPLLAPLAVIAAVCLGLFRLRRTQVIGSVRRRLVQPHIDRTMGVATRHGARRVAARQIRRQPGEPLARPAERTRATR